MSAATYLRLLVIPFCFSLTSCEALFSSGGGRRTTNGYSLDNPPTGRYLAETESTPSTPPPGTTIITPPPGPGEITGPTIESTEPTTITETPSSPPSVPTPPPTNPVPPPPVSTTPAAPSYGKPVPGRQGFVYPPGVDAKPENMVDVREFSPGQKVRDPRTGKIFLVP